MRLFEATHLLEEIRAKVLLLSGDILREGKLLKHKIYLRANLEGQLFGVPQGGKTSANNHLWESIRGVGSVHDGYISEEHCDTHLKGK